MSRKPKIVPDKSPSGEQRQPYKCSDKAPFGGFINIRITSQELNWFRDWQAKGEENIPALLDDILALGAKYSVVYDTENECFIASLTGRLALTSSDVRQVTSSRAETRDVADALLVWKHYQLAGGDYSKYVEEKSGKFQFG